jgi:KipI family sensor histidine kinase inhibitor
VVEDGAARVIPFGDSALLLVLGHRIDVALNGRVHALANAVRELRAGDPEGAGRALAVPVPAYASVLVPYDPERLTLAKATELLAAVARTVASGAETATAESAQTPVEIPVRYGGEHGPDLAQVAALHGLTPGDVVELHAGTTYRVFMLGFAPGFPYLGPLPGELATPRRSSPRTAVPAGSVGIAGEQTGIYPLTTPGGWQLIGRTDVRLWEVARDPPALLRPGQRVRFVPLPG